MKIRVHNNVLRRLVVLDKELPTITTPWSQLDNYFRMFVMPKLDIRSKFSGCWMWTGATTTDGEPKLAVRDNFTKNERGTGIGVAQTTLVKEQIVNLYIDTRKVPRRRFKGKPIAKADIQIVHMCGNLSCLNPAHLCVCLDTPRQRDVSELRDKYLAPGTYYVE